MMWLNVAGAVITTAMGFLGLLFPAKASSLTGLKAVTVAGRAEFRGTLGVTFILLGLTPLLTQEAHAFLVVGLAWLGAAIGRLVSILVDDGNDRQNWGAVAFEAVVAACLLAGEPIQALAVGSA
jgi:Domain of unknown function (DUF4345)